MNNELLDIVLCIYVMIVLIIRVVKCFIQQIKISELELLNKYASGIFYEDGKKKIKLPDTATITEIKDLLGMGFCVVTKK
ncbi:hypothetical protein ACH34C_07165 [Elizabethkingia anophelis]|uniref:hypothetical protein n=1 Tax=Elizabethkingia anophelis TaxID=1117645 RepID=UPI003786FE68